MGLRKIEQLTCASVLILTISGCDVATSPSALRSSEYSAELAYCADEINRYRGLQGQPPLERSRALEDFAAEAARRDGSTYRPHYYFTTTNGGGIARAETAILWWTGGSVRTIIRRGLQQMWNGAPDGEHYVVLAGNYSQVGCGLFVNGREVTVVQEFR